MFKNFLLSLTMIFAMATATVSFADEPAATATVTSVSTSPATYTAPELGDPSAKDVQDIITAVGGIKGAGTLAIVALICQILMVGLKSKLGTFAGGWQLVIVTGLSLIGGVANYAIMHDVTIGAALVSGFGLAAIQVFGHQVLGKIGIGSAASNV